MRLVRSVRISLYLLLLLNTAWVSAQDTTPTPVVPWYQQPEANVPYIVLLVVALLATVFGILVRPLLTFAGNSLLQWVKGWGKGGRFRQQYLTSVIGRCRHLPMLPAKIVMARWRYRRKAAELEELYTPLSLGTYERDDAHAPFDLVQWGVNESTDQATNGLP